MTITFVEIYTIPVTLTFVRIFTKNRDRIFLANANHSVTVSFVWVNIISYTWYLLGNLTTIVTVAFGKIYTNTVTVTF